MFGSCSANRDPRPPIQATIARIDGESAVRGYDEVLDVEPFEGAQFLRLQRNAVLQDAVESAARDASVQVLRRIELPVIE
jgi:hypothetical protein